MGKSESKSKIQQAIEEADLLVKGQVDGFIFHTRQIPTPPVGTVNRGDTQKQAKLVRR